jgi:CRP-like cAMP-binding protein
LLVDSSLGLRRLASSALFARQRAERHLEKGEYLFQEAEPCEGFFVVQRGVINVHRVSAAGKVQVIHVFSPGDSFAEAALISREGYPATARPCANFSAKP